MYKIFIFMIFLFIASCSRENSKTELIKYSGCDKTGLLNFTNEYDQAHNNIKSTFYNSNGNILFYYINEYDSNGNIIKQSRFNSLNKLLGYDVFEFNRNKELVKQSNYNTNEKLKKIISIENNKINSSIYDDLQKLRSEFNYDIKSKTEKYTDYYTNIKIKSSYEFSNISGTINNTNYNKNGIINSYLEYDINAIKQKEMKYDNFGRITNELLYQNGLLVKITDFDTSGKVHNYVKYNYDKYGNKLSVKAFDAKGNEIQM